MQARHVFKLLDIDYVHLPKISQSFKDSLPESTLLYNFTDQFIVGSGYTYSFNNYDPQNRLRNTHSSLLLRDGGQPAVRAFPPDRCG